MPVSSVEEAAGVDIKVTNISKVKKKLKNGILKQRSEASQSISEFNLSEIGKEKVQLHELIRTSQKLSGQASVKKQLDTAKKLKSLSIPLSKPQLEKIKRTVAYEKVCEEVTKWDSIVRSNRAAEQIIFPLKKPELFLENLDTVAESFVTKHPVQVAVEELLKTTDHKFQKEKPLTAAEEKALQAMSLKEARLRHRELMMHRSLISYQEAKARRQNKIKSKRYHRMLKKEKLKKIMKEFEVLQKTDSAAALEKVLEADKLRVMERMTLKHRNTGKWAKLQKIRAKYNPEARSVLKEDISIGREFKEKRPEIEKSITHLKNTLEEEEEMTQYDSGLIEEAEPKSVMDIATMELSGESPPASVPSLLDKFSLEKHLEEVEEPMVKPVPAKAQEATSDFVDMEFISKATTLNSYNPSSISLGDDMDEVEGDNDLDEEFVEGVKNVSEAFADEDLIAEFREDKKIAEKLNRPKGIDLFLPGWGRWDGAGIKIPEQKKKRFFIKPPNEANPKKPTVGNVIINEEKDKKASVHQVSHVPFPFFSVAQFESHIRQPIGHTWNTQGSFQSLIAPKVITKMGKVIEPIDAEDVVLQKKSAPNTAVKKKKVKISEQKAF